MRKRRSKNRGFATRGPKDGILYRSRLEARWSTMFWLLNWPFTYEPPVDLLGYIPDFAIPFGLGECKPFLSLTDKTIAQAAAKTIDAGYKDECYYFGAKLFTDDLDRVVIGLTNDGQETPDVLVPFHLVRDSGDWYPCSGSKCHADKEHVAHHAWVRYLWSEAGNMIQWKKPREK